MRTLLVSLALFTVLCGCSTVNTHGMESMGSISEFKKNSGNCTQVSESYPEYGIDDVSSDIGSDVFFALDIVLFGLPWSR